MAGVASTEAAAVAVCCNHALRLLEVVAQSDDEGGTQARHGVTTSPITYSHRQRENRFRDIVEQEEQVRLFLVLRRLEEEERVKKVTTSSSTAKTSTREREAHVPRILDFVRLNRWKPFHSKLFGRQLPVVGTGFVNDGPPEAFANCIHCDHLTLQSKTYTVTRRSRYGRPRELGAWTAAMGRTPV